MFSYTYKEEKVKTTVDAQGNPAIAINSCAISSFDDWARDAVLTVNSPALVSGLIEIIHGIANANKQVTLQITSEFEKISGNQATIHLHQDDQLSHQLTLTFH